MLIFVTFVSPIANTYARRINAMLGVSTSEVVSSGSSTEDTAYFKSDYGTDIYDLEQLAQLEADAAVEEVRQVEAGVVLLKNDNDALPLAAGSSVTLFGQSTVNPFYSYHSVSNSMQTLVTYVDSMRSEYDVNETLVSAYSSSGYIRVRSDTAPVIGEAPAEFYTDALKQSWQTSYNDAAIVFITRQGGEDCDLVMETSEGIGQLALHQDERDMLAMLQQEKANGVFDKIIVLVNANSAMELGWLEEYDVDACLWVGTPGVVGFTGVANVLTGEVSPSGHLVDTYAKNSLSAPAYVNAGQNSYTWANLDEVTAYCSDDAKYVSYYITYAEGIYVGYKYFEPRYEDAILNQGGAISSVDSSTGMAWNYTDEVSYPFGYGLSYTTFEQELTGVTYSADTDMYTVSVAVSNTGDVAGKSVVQVYAQTPYGDYEKTYNVEKAATVVAAAALIFYFTVGAPNVRVTVFLILALVCGAAGFAVKHIAADAAGILALACVTYVFCRYLNDSVSVFFDVLNGISMFGSGGDLTSVIIMLVLLLVSVFGYIVSGFIKRVG